MKPKSPRPPTNPDSPEALDTAPALSSLLAAHADDGLDGDERARVEQFLADQPEQQAEVAALREVLAQVRELAPRPQVEPDWNRLTRDISRACDEVAAAQEAGQGRALGRWIASVLRPRYAFGLAGLALAALVLFLALRGDARSPAVPSDSDGIAQTSSDRQTSPASDDRTGDDDDDLDLAVAAADGDLDELDERALDELAGNLTSEFAADGETEEDDSGVDGEPVLSPEMAAEWADLGNRPDAEPAEQADFDLALFAEPDYESWLDDLSEAELDALEAYLAKEQAG